MASVPSGVFVPAAHSASLGTVAGAGPHDVSLLGVLLAALVLLAIASIVAARFWWVLAILLRERTVSLRARCLTPQKITTYTGAKRAEETPEIICRRIVERSRQIRRTLLCEPSEAEIELCAIGYDTCLGDLVTLARLVGERCPKANPIRRRRLGVSVRRAADSVALTRKAFPSEVLVGDPAEGAEGQTG